MAASITVKGGDKLARKLEEFGRGMAAGAVKVGFLEGAMYPPEQRYPTRLLKGLNKLNGTRRRVTPPGGGAPEVGSPLPVAQAAFWNEYGTATAPSRSFMRNTVAARTDAWKEAVVRLAKASNFNSEITLLKVGSLMKDDFVRAIKEWPADNAPLTVAIKGFNKGLIDRGIMQRSVDYALVKDTKTAGAKVVATV